MKNYRIRQLGPGHADLIHAQRLDNELFGPHSLWTDYEKSEWFIAYTDGAPWKQPVAFAGVQWINKREAFLCRCGVLEEHRGNGLQLLLVRKRTNLCRELGIKTIYTYTTPDNAWSMRNLISNKFKPCIFPDHLEDTDLDVGAEVVYWSKST